MRQIVSAARTHGNPGWLSKSPTRRAGPIAGRDDGYLTLTAAGLTCDRREELQDLVQQENETRDTFVEAIQVYVPAMECEAKDAIRHALNHWAASKVFESSRRE
jgi:hypothetical protein